METNHAGEVFPGTKEEIREYMAEKGYVYHTTVADGKIFSHNFIIIMYLFVVDDVFVRKDLYEGKYAPDLEMQKWFDNIPVPELSELDTVLDIQLTKDEL